MKLIKPSYEIITPIDSNYILLELERYGRVSHLTEPKEEGDPVENATKFIKKWGINANHSTILEAFDITVEFTCNRGFSHEGVRHRLTSPMQESTRYCNYSKDKFNKELNIIDIRHHFKNPSISIDLWFNAIEYCENAYMALIEAGEPAELARDVLPNALKTILDIKCNIREWRHIFKLRTAKAAHPQMRELMCPLLDEFKSKIPILFDDINY